MKKRAKIRRDAQAALEFLMTYGWAIMAVLLAIGSLSYFGVLSPDNFIPRRCSLEPGIGCVDFRVNEDSVKLILMNGKGEDIFISDIRMGNCTGTASGTLKNGDKAEFVVGGCGNAVNKKFIGGVNISFTGETGLARKNMGNIVGKAEAGCGLCACQNTDISCGAYPSCSNCNSLDGYSANYCSASNVFRNFSDYSCASQACNPTATPELVLPSCTASNGICQSSPSVQCACADTASSCGAFPNCNNCAPNNGICSSGACSCSNTASSCGTYPNCLSCGANKMCYTESCLWNLSGMWTIAYPTQGNKRANLVQTGAYVEAILIDDLNPGPNPGEWAVRFTISGNSINGDANNVPDVYPILPYRGTITAGGAYIDGEFEYTPNSGNWFALDISKN